MAKKLEKQRRVSPETRSFYETTLRLRLAAARNAVSLEIFGDELATREGYRSVRGLDAIHLYLTNKHHWLPCIVRALSDEDLRFVLQEEMQGWTLPPGLRDLSPAE